MQANLVITSQNQAGTKITTTITYINPDATNAKLKALATALNNLTKNEYINATRATKNEDLDTTPSDEKLTPTLIVSDDGLGNVTYNGDGTLSAQSTGKEGTGQYAENIFYNVTNNKIYWNTGNHNYDPDWHWTGILTATEGANYKGASTTFTVYL